MIYLIVDMDVLDIVYVLGVLVGMIGGMRIDELFEVVYIVGSYLFV